MLGTRLTDEERARIAELAATRLPSRLIAKEVGRSHRAVWSYVHKLRRPVPAERRRSPLRLSLTEREEISRGVAGGESFRAIAGRLGRAPSTVSREGDQRWTPSLSGLPGRQRRPGSSAPTQGGETGDLRAAPGGGGGQTREALVTPADRGVAANGLSWRYGDAGVARDDLPVAVRPDPWGAAQGTDPLPATQTYHPATPRPLDLQRPGPAARHAAHQPTSRRSRGPGGAGPLGISMVLSSCLSDHWRGSGPGSVLA